MHYWKSTHRQPMVDLEQIRDLEHNHKGMQIQSLAIKHKADWGSTE
jgi:hypothetical protein